MPFILGEGPLKDLALALFVGMMAGAYSSIFIATPLLAQLKEREPDMQKLAKRVAARRAKEGAKENARELGRDTSEEPKPRRSVKESAAAAADPVPAEELEPVEDGRESSGAELAEVAQTRVTVSSAAPIGPLRPLGDGAAKRPQPQHKPRSQRKK